MRGCSVLICCVRIFNGADLALKFLARLCDNRSGSTLYGDSRDPREATQVDMFVSLAYTSLRTADEALLTSLDEHLSTKQFFVGDSLTIADVAIWAALASHAKWAAMASKATVTAKTHVHLLRWFSMCNYMEQFAEAKEKVGVVCLCQLHILCSCCPCCMG